MREALRFRSLLGSGSFSPPRCLRSGRRRHFLAALLAPGLAAPLLAWSQPTQGAEVSLTTMSLEELMNVPVMSQTVSSVSRTESTIGHSPAAVSVITQEMIHRSGATSIPELLRMVPGVNVARLDSNRWVISVRGFDNTLANKLLVQVDGRTVYSPVQSGVFWDTVDYPLEDIERIEVVRGPGGTDWGANAVNGVINIITKSAKDTQGGLISGGGGSEERGFATFRFGGKLGDNLHYRVYGKWFERDTSFSLANLAHDDWRSGRSGFRLDWTPTGEDTVTFQGDWFSVVSGRTPLADTESRGVDVLGRWTHQLGKNSSWQLQAYYDRFQQTGRNGGFKFAVDTADLDFQHNFRLGEAQKFVYGFAFRYQKILVKGFTTTTGAITSVLERIHDEPSVLSAFLQDEIKLIDDRLFLTLGSKIENNDFTGFEYQPSGRLLWTPTTTQAVWLAVSRAVRTPDILEDAFDLRSPLTSIVPNHALRSEEVVAYELGYRVQPTKRFSFDSALFYNQYNRLSVITLLPAAAGRGIPFQFVNGMDGEVFGVELAATWNPTEWWQIYGAYSYLKLNLHADPNLPALPTSPHELPEKQSPQNHFYLRSAFDIPGNVEFDLIGRYVDSIPLPPLGVDSYVALDARLAWKPRKNLELAIVGQNLLDNHHPESVGAPPFEIERSVYGIVTVQW